MIHLLADDVIDSGNRLDQGTYTGLVHVNDSYELLHIGLQVGRALG